MRRRQGFTLVELLVVIGIIALLIAILLPALSKAQEQARMTQCKSTMRNMAQAVALHCADHKGFAQICGCEWDMSVGGGAMPAGLDDAFEKKYTYYNDGGIHRPAPLSVAMGLMMGLKVNISDRTLMQNDMARPEFQKYFRCPSHTNVILGLTQADGNGWSAPGTELMSFIFNEAILGRREAGKGTNWPRGNLSRVKHSSDVVLFCDGLPRGLTAGGWLTMPEDGQRNWTLYDYYQAHQGDYKNFDVNRHRGVLNVIFVDGHCDTVTFLNGLKSVGLTKGMDP